MGFVDETKEKGYLIVVTLVLPKDIQIVRKTLQGLRKPGQSRIHFSKESDRRRREILSVIRHLPQSSFFFRSEFKNQGLARAECLTALTQAVDQLKIHRLVLETEETYRAADRRIIKSAIAKSEFQSLEYIHESPASEPCLWIPDAIAWSIQRGGEWRRRAGVT